MTDQTPKAEYGVGDASFQAAGGEAGIRALVRDFYLVMRDLPAAAQILAMHPADLDESEDKLARFLCGWLGGPKRYSEKYGSIRLPLAHQHLDIGEAERDAWMQCMQAAVEKQPFQDAFKHYLLTQLSVPAERVRAVAQARRASQS